jgi:hypothetical protein
MKLPEPSFPEHDLIRSAAPSPNLSSGLKERVISKCGSQIRLARLKLRVTVGISTLAACGLLFMLLTQNTTNPDGGDPGVTSADAEQPSNSSSRSDDYRSRDGLATHEPSPDGVDSPLATPREMKQIDRLIEERIRRNRMLECALLPFL